MVGRVDAQRLANLAEIKVRAIGAFESEAFDGRRLTVITRYRAMNVTLCFPFSK